MRRTACLLLTGLGLTFAGPGNARPSGQAATAQSLDLAVLFGPRGIARDSNGDGIADSVAARVVVPDAPTVEDRVALHRF